MRYGGCHAGGFCPTIGIASKCRRVTAETLRVGTVG
jgi:hypothetical protein